MEWGYMMVIRKSLMAGLEISIGCIAFLSVGGGVLGAFLFAFGLLTVCTRSDYLYTGKVCYLTRDSTKTILIIAVFNLIAVIGMGQVARYALPNLLPYAERIVDGKLAYAFDSPSTAKMIALPILCNCMIFFAVDKFDPKSVSSVARLFLAVMVFILCGFEHSIANGFYFSMTGRLFTYRGAVFMLNNILWNGIGGFCVIRLANDLIGD